METYSPTSVNVNKVLYILHTIMPESSCQCPASHTLANVPLMNQVSKLQLTTQITDRKVLIVMFNLGLSPMKQWKQIVTMRAVIEAREAAVSCVRIC